MGNIPLPALAVRPPENPLDQMTRMVQLRSLLGQQKLQQQQYQQGQLANQQLQQQMANEKSVRDLYNKAAQTGQTPSDADVMSAAGPRYGAEILKAHQDLQKSRTDLQNAQADYQGKSLDYFGSLANSIKASGYDPQVADTLLQHAASQPGFGSQAGQLRTQVQQNPGMLRQITDNAIAASNKQRELAAQEMAASARKQQADVSAQKAGLDIPATAANPASSQNAGAAQSPSQSTADPMNIQLTNGKQFLID